MKTWLTWIIETMNVLSECQYPENEDNKTVEATWSNLSASDDEEGEQGGTGGGLQQQVHALDGGRAARVPKLQTRQNGAHEQQQNGAADDRRLLQTAAVTAVQRLKFIVGEPVPVQ